MAVIRFKKFGGEIPQLPAHLLPDEAAQKAVNCDFTHGNLAPLKQAAALKISGSGGWTGTNPTKGMYTEDGTNFFTWASDTTAYKSPVIDDTYKRVYYLQDQKLWVTSYGLATSAGGTPSEAYVAGVPSPNVAPRLTTVNRSTLPDYPNAAVTIKVWYEAGGVRYNETTLSSYVSSTAFSSYTFLNPVRTADRIETTTESAGTDGDGNPVLVQKNTTIAGTPATAVLVAEVSIASDSGGSNVLLRATTRSGSQPVQSSALPGGVELAIAKVDETQSRVTLTWGIVETRAYVFTNVNTWNEESAPSAPALISCTYMQDVRVTMPYALSGTSMFSGAPASADAEILNLYATYEGRSSWSQIDEEGYYYWVKVKAQYGSANLTKWFIAAASENKGSYGLEALPSNFSGDTSILALYANYEGRSTWNQVDQAGYYYWLRIKELYGIEQTTKWFKEAVSYNTSSQPDRWFTESTPIVAPSQLWAYGARPLKQHNIYRTFGSNPTYLRIGVIPGGGSDYTDSKRSATEVGSALSTANYYQPPGGLSNLVLLPNGFFAASSGNTLWFSEPYHPHAWPYSMTFNKDIVGICLGAQALVVTTKEGVYSVAGAHPNAMSPTRLPAPQAGISNRMMVSMEGAVAYASNDGIVLVQGSNASLDFSRRYFNREDWRTNYSSVLFDGAGALRFAYHDGFLVAASAISGKGFIVRTDEANYTYTRYSDTIDAFFQLPLRDTLYFSKGSTIYEFRAGSSNYTYEWWSKDFIFPKPVAFGAGYMRTGGATEIRLYADGVEYYRTTISSTGYFRIPSARKPGDGLLPSVASGIPGSALRWSVYLTGTYTVDELYLASSMNELKNA